MEEVRRDRRDSLQLTVQEWHFVTEIFNNSHGAWKAHLANADEQSQKAHQVLQEESWHAGQ